VWQSAGVYFQLRMTLKASDYQWFVLLSSRSDISTLTIMTGLWQYSKFYFAPIIVAGYLVWDRHGNDIQEKIEEVGLFWRIGKSDFFSLIDSDSVAFEFITSTGKAFLAVRAHDNYSICCILTYLFILFSAGEVFLVFRADVNCRNLIIHNSGLTSIVRDEKSLQWTT
jgi:hypothetical protein